MTHVITALREHLDLQRWHPDATVASALAAAINTLAVTSPHNAKVLMAILDQRGCEHLDPGKDELVHAISVIVFG